MAEKAPPPGGTWDATQYHVVEPGDTLPRLARKYQGDASLYMQIYEANHDRLKDPDLIKVGQKLRIP